VDPQLKTSRRRDQQEDNVMDYAGGLMKVLRQLTIEINPISVAFLW
jgi:hypothetical protein